MFLEDWIVIGQVDLLVGQVLAKVSTGPRPEACKNSIGGWILNKGIRAVVVEVGARGIEIEVEITGCTKEIIESVICTLIVYVLVCCIIIEEGCAIELCFQFRLEAVYIIGALTKSSSKSGPVKFLNVNRGIVLGGAEVVEAVQEVDLREVEGGNITIYTCHWIY